MLDNIFRYLFLAGLLVAGVIRGIYGRRHKQTKVVAAHKESAVVWLLMALWGVSQVIPYFYIFTSWLGFADYHLPAWMGWTGIVIFVFGVWLLWRSHEDLGRNWRPTLEIVEQPTLVTEGVYQRIRHPMYAAHLLYAVGQALLLQNWLAGLSALAVFLPLYALRVPREEAMLLEHFGEAYRVYADRTGRILPRFSR